MEFLIAQKGKGEHTALKTNLGITAQALRHLELLNTNTVAVKYLGISITIPEPEAFVLHKMIINSERKDKLEKDQLVINRMYGYLDKERFDALREKLTRKEQKAVNTYLETIIHPMLEQEAVLEKAKQAVATSVIP